MMGKVYLALGLAMRYKFNLPNLCKTATTGLLTLKFIMHLRDV